MNENLEKIKTICGQSPENQDFSTIASDPNFIFVNDPGFNTVRLFDIDGNIINHECKEILGRLNNLIEFCLPIDDRADGLWDLLKKETS